MAQLDRFLSVMVANGADSIQLTEREVATLQKDGAPRPITKQPLTAQQLLLLLREIAPPDAAQQLAAGSATTFSLRERRGPVRGSRIARRRPVARIDRAGRREQRIRPGGGGGAERSGRD